jgi:hypothetical protein
MARTTKSSAQRHKGETGRVTQRSEATGRYTPPIPKAKRQSPPWFPYVLLGALVAGLVLIVLNYVEVLPGAPSTYYLLGGLVLILIGAIMATRYH